MSFKISRTKFLHQEKTVANKQYPSKSGDNRCQKATACHHYSCSETKNVSSHHLQLSGLLKQDQRKGMVSVVNRFCGPQKQLVLPDGGSLSQPLSLLPSVREESLGLGRDSVHLKPAGCLLVLWSQQIFNFSALVSSPARQEQQLSYTVTSPLFCFCSVHVRLPPHPSSSIAALVACAPFCWWCFRSSHSAA